MNFHELYRKIEAIDKGVPQAQIDEISDPYGERGKPDQHKKISRDVLDPTTMSNTNVSPADRIKKRLGLDYRGDARDRAGQPRSLDYSKKPQLPAESVEEEIEECGDMGPMGSMPPAKQMDSVNMNVSMNANGSGGIRDLLNVLKDIQDGQVDNMSGSNMDGDSDTGSDILIKKNLDSMADLIDDDFGNSAPGDSGPKTMELPDVGADLHHPKEPEQVHTMHPAAGVKLKDGASFKLPKGDIQVRLENLYNNIKLREGSAPKEKQKTPYRDINSAEYKNAAAKQKEKMSTDEKAKPGKALLKNIKAK